MEGLDAVILAGQNLGNAKTAGGDYAVIPGGSEVEDLERFQAAPRRARGAVTAATVETLCAYINQFKGAGTAIFADPEKSVVVGILDYHQPTAPAFCEHRVRYAAPHSLEWKTWIEANGKRMAQADFAQFIENNVIDIRTPPGADVLEVARSLQAKKSVEFASAIRLVDGGQQFTYSETIDGSSRNGTLKVPEEFTLGIPVFLGGPLYEVRARLRYRIDSGKLQLWYELYRPEYIQRDAFSAICDAVGVATSIEIWHGAP